MLALALFAACACTKKDVAKDSAVPPDPGPADGACRQYQTTAQTIGKTPTVLPELSGLAASRAHPGIFWAHNDSGNATELFAIRESGEVAAKFPLEGVVAQDAEDLALGPCGAQDSTTCLYLADIGDNLQMRTALKILKVREPASLDPVSLSAEVLSFRYPDGAHDAESLVVDPKTATLYVLTKSPDSLGALYRLDGLAPGSEAEATLLGALRSRNGLDHVSTGASLHPTATRLLVRTYSHVWELRREGATSLEDLLNTEGVQLPGPSSTAQPQPQSEAISYTVDGRGYVIGSEGEGAPLLRVDCRN